MFDFFGDIAAPERHNGDLGTGDGFAVFVHHSSGDPDIWLGGKFKIIFEEQAGGGFDFFAAQIVRFDFAVGADEPNGGNAFYAEFSDDFAASRSGAESLCPGHVVFGDVGLGGSGFVVYADAENDEVFV
jgi:hypothetical protein